MKQVCTVNAIYGNIIEPKSTLNVLHHTESQRTSDSGNSGGKRRLTVTLDSLSSAGAIILSEIVLVQSLSDIVTITL